jgi:hypothetical protein
LKQTDVSEVRTASIAFIGLMIEAVCTSKMLVSFNETTRRYISEDYYLHTRRRENLNLTTSYSSTKMKYNFRSKYFVHHWRTAINAGTLQNIIFRKFYILLILYQTFSCLSI